MLLEVGVGARVVFPAVEDDRQVFAADVFPVRGLAPEDLLELRNRERLDLVCGGDVDGQGVQRDAELLRLGATALHELLPFFVLDRAARVREVCRAVDQGGDPVPEPPPETWSTLPGLASMKACAQFWARITMVSEPLMVSVELARFCGVASEPSPPSRLLPEVHEDAASAAARTRKTQ